MATKDLRAMWETNVEKEKNQMEKERKRAKAKESHKLQKIDHKPNDAAIISRVSSSTLTMNRIDSDSVTCKKPASKSGFKHLLVYGDALSTLLPMDQANVLRMCNTKKTKSVYKYLKETLTILKWGVMREDLLNKLQNSGFVSQLHNGEALAFDAINDLLSVLPQGRLTIADCLSKYAPGKEGLMEFPDFKSLSIVITTMNEAKSNSHHALNTKYYAVNVDQLLEDLLEYKTKVGDMDERKEKEVDVILPHLLQNWIQRCFIALAAHRFGGTIQDGLSTYERVKCGLLCPIFWDFAMTIGFHLRTEWEDATRPPDEMKCVCSLNFVSPPFTAILVDLSVDNETQKLNSDKRMADCIGLEKLIAEMRLRLDRLVKETRTNAELEKIKMYGLHWDSKNRVKIVCVKPVISGTNFTASLSDVRRRRKSLSHSTLPISGTTLSCVAYSMDEIESLQIATTVTNDDGTKYTKINVHDCMKLMGYLVSMARETIPFLSELYNNAGKRDLIVPPDPHELPLDEVYHDQHVVQLSWRRFVTDHAIWFFTNQIEVNDQATALAKSFCKRLNIQIESEISPFNVKFKALFLALAWGLTSFMQGNAVVFKGVSLENSKIPPNTKLAIVVKLRVKGRSEEGNILQQFNDHPNIIHLYFCCTEGRFTVLIEDWIHVCKKSEAMDVTDIKAIQIMKQLLHALVRIHAANVIHRDIKPANLGCCERNGEMVLMDFDFAIRCPYESLLFANVGTVGYKAPEILNGTGYTLSADIFSLGTTIHTLFAEVQKEMIDSSIQEYPQGDPKSNWQKIAKLVSKMISSNPLDRPSALHCWSMLTGEVHPLVAPIKK